MSAAQPNINGGEFGIIRDYFDRGYAAKHQQTLSIGIGDDAAVLKALPTDRCLVTCIDTLVAGRHFPEDTPPADIGWKALTVNLSDLAAMGAKADWFQLALTLPSADVHWLAEFSRGLFEAADAYGVALIGGDTTSGPLTITVQAAGNIAAGMAITRGGAQPDDLICLSGPIGGGALGLKQWSSGRRRGAAIDQLNRPLPQLQFGAALAGIATAAIDISDGLLQDLGHVLKASMVGATVQIDKLPLFTDGVVSASVDMALAGGDDYQLLFTLPPDKTAQLMSLCENPGDGSSAISLPVCVGVIEKDPGLRCIDAAGAPYTSPARGWQHF